MPRQVMRAAALAALAALPEAAAFTAPTHSLALKTSAGAFCARSQPVSGMGRRAERRQSATALKMELLGKRYWMWNASEWMFDKFVALTQVVVFTLYGVITRLFESPYDEARLKAIRRRIAELRASREMSEPRNALDMMDVVWEVGAADEKVGAPASGSSDDNKPMASDSNRIGSTGRTLTPDGAVDAPSMDPRMAFSFALVSIPVLLEFISYVSDDLYLRALGSASVWFVGLQEHSVNVAGAAPRRAPALAPLLPLLAVVLVPGVAGAEPPEWLEDTRSSLDLGLAIFSLLFFLRIPLTWYPQMDLKKLPQAIVAIPTEPFCAAVRKVTPPLFGVDISPVVLYGVLSFVREIFLGQQGVLTMMADK